MKRYIPFASDFPHLGDVAKMIKDGMLHWCPTVAVNAKNTVYIFVFEICVHLKFGCLRGRIRLTSFGLTMNDHFGLWQST